MSTHMCTSQSDKLAQPDVDNLNNNLGWRPTAVGPQHFGPFAYSVFISLGYQGAILSLFTYL